MKTNELTGAALDWAVAKCGGLETYLDDGVVCLKGQPFDDNSHYWLPTQNWSQGGPIIERERLNLSPVSTGVWECWPDYGMSDELYAGGPTPLIAAMRCYVASKLGDDVEIPEELV